MNPCKNYCKDNRYQIINRSLMKRTNCKMLIAHFMRRGNQASIDQAKILYNNQSGNFIVYISSGNASDDFDQIIITTRNGYPIMDIFMVRDQFVLGFGTYELRGNINNTYERRH